MAGTQLFSVPTGSDFTVKAWSSRLHADAVMGSGIIAEMMDDGILWEETDLSKNQGGDRIRVQYSKRLTGKGLVGDAPVRSSATAPTFVYDDVVINKLTKAVKSKTDGSMAQQRTAFDLGERDYAEVVDWFKQRMSFSAFNQLLANTATAIAFEGDVYTGTDIGQVTGFNTVTAASQYRAFYSGGQVSDTAVGANTTATIKLADLDAMRLEAKQQRAGINNFKPIMNKPYQYKLFLGNAGFVQLIQQADNAGLTLPAILKAQLAGGSYKDSAFDGEGFDYFNVRVRCVPDHFLTAGISGGVAVANTKRALFAGREAGVIAFGKGYGKGSDSVPGFNIIEDMDKIEEERLTKVTGIYGLKAAVVDGYQQSAITLSHYTA